MKRTTGWQGRAVMTPLLCSTFAVLGSCSSNQVCTVMACMDGLTVQLDGSPPAGSAYQVEISEITAAGTTSVAHCDWSASDAGWPPLRCSSKQSHVVFDGSVRLQGATIPKVRVTVREGATAIADQTLSPEYTSKEINGPGCGVCTSAAVAVVVTEPRDI